MTMDEVAVDLSVIEQEMRKHQAVVPATPVRVRMHPDQWREVQRWGVAYHAHPVQNLAEAIWGCPVELDSELKPTEVELVYSVETPSQEGP